MAQHRCAHGKLSRFNCLQLYSHIVNAAPCDTDAGCAALRASSARSTHSKLQLVKRIALSVGQQVAVHPACRYSLDPKAREWANKLSKRNEYATLHPSGKHFLALPFEHDETIAGQQVRQSTNAACLQTCRNMPSKLGDLSGLMAREACFCAKWPAARRYDKSGLPTRPSSNPVPPGPSEMALAAACSQLAHEVAPGKDILSDI